MLKLWINSLIYQKLKEHLFYQNTYFTILHMWLQQPCHVWGGSFYNDSSRLETVNFCRKEFHLKFSWFLSPPLLINITVSIFFSRKTIISCFRNFKLILHCLPSPRMYYQKRSFCFSFKRMFCDPWTFVFFNCFFRKNFLKKETLKSCEKGLFWKFFGKHIWWSIK